MRIPTLATVLCMSLATIGGAAASPIPSSSGASLASGQEVLLVKHWSHGGWKGRHYGWRRGRHLGWYKHHRRRW
jgi:hypothetical protein